MESSSNKNKTDGDFMTTTGNGNGQKKIDEGKEGESFNPFARTSKIGRTPPKGPRPRMDSCPEIKIPLTNVRGQEERDKRKRSETITPPSDLRVTASCSEKESRTGEGDEVFVVEASPSPDSARETKKRKEQGFSALRAAWKKPVEPDLRKLADDLLQLTLKLEKKVGALFDETKKHTNTKVEIKKLVREVGALSMLVTGHVKNYCSKVDRKLQTSGDPDETRTSATTGSTQDAASQTDPPRKQKGEEIRRVTEAVTEAEILDAVGKRWPEAWFQRTTINVGNPWNTTGDVDFAIFVPGDEEQMEGGIARLLRDRFPEIATIEGTGSLNVVNTVQVGTGEPTTKTRAIHRVSLGGTTDVEVLTAVRVLQDLTPENKTIAVPVPTGTDEAKFRKLAELVFIRSGIKVALYTPQGRGVKGKSKIGPIPQGKDKREKNTEVLLVKQEGKTYGDMVRGLRALTGVKNDFLKDVRKSQDGRLLLAFKKGEEEVERMRSLIKTAWEGATVSGGGRGDPRKGVLHVKGLDPGVEEEEIREAVHSIVPNLQKEDLEVGEKRPVFGGNFAVTLKVPNRFLHEVSSHGKLKIGLNMCRVEERVQVTKCFRCWGYGHLARACKGPDRRNLCSGCGQEGHLVAECNNAPQYVEKATTLRNMWRRPQERVGGVP